MESNLFKKFREALPEKPTQRQIADLAGVTETTIRNWESGRSAPSLSDAEKLSVVYKKTRGQIEHAIVQWHRKQGELATVGK